MLILPAIDLRGGLCVRLRQGNYDEETVFSSEPVAIARRWVSEGAPYLHLVDLDGAREGRPVNGEAIRRIVADAGVPCQLGGGLRDEPHVAQALDWGVDRVVLGTKALDDPDWFMALCQRYPGRVVLGIDVRHGRVATDGWSRFLDRTMLDVARQFAGLPLGAVVYTDIGRDGMLAGPNLVALSELIAEVQVPVIASGGVSTLEDVRHLARLGSAGCVIGRALYEGRLHLSEVIQAAGAEAAGPHKARSADHS